MNLQRDWCTLLSCPNLAFKNELADCTTDNPFPPIWESFFRPLSRLPSLSTTLDSAFFSPGDFFLR
jgi:hypothetical protein